MICNLYLLVRGMWKDNFSKIKGLRSVLVRTSLLSEVGNLLE